MKAFVLTFDCLPSHVLGCYGNQTIATPHFDRLASESIVFDANFGEDFDVDANSHAWWTGRYQFARSIGPQQDQTSLRKMLSAAGVELHIISDHEEQARLRELASSNASSQLVWVKYPGVNLSCSPQDRQAVARNVEALDRELGKILACLADASASDQHLLILTSSRGLPMGDSHGATKTSPAIELTESTVRVPLLIRSSIAEMGTRRQCLTQSVDILPTLLDWFHIEATAYALEGESLLPIVLGEKENQREHLCLGWLNRERAIRTQNFYLVERLGDRQAQTRAEGDEHNRSLHLFKKPEDRFDVYNVADQFPDVCTALRQTLTDFELRIRSPAAE